MIQTKDDLKRYIKMDARALGVNPRKHYWYGKEVWRFERSLRKYEYCLNCLCNPLIRLYWRYI